MARISFTKYNNSKAATVISFISSGFKYCGIFTLSILIIDAIQNGKSEDFWSSIVIAVLFLCFGLFLEFCAEKLAKKQMMKLYNKNNNIYEKE